MKILHTADWHLGRRLLGQELAPEQDAALDAILALVRERRIDALVHAGDVFDSVFPPVWALKQYYSFLVRLIEAGCGTVIITGGNHDSPAALNAPKDLLETMNICVVGGATENIADEIIPVKNAAGKTLGYCAAVPFLRDKDLRYSVPGETNDERSRRIVENIRSHYAHAAKAALGRRQDDGNEGAPIFATGHLFAQGGVTGDLDGKEPIHVGNLGQIGADAFPEEFSYVALGHLHRPQIVAKRDSVRYSGSLVALDFSERDDAKQVLIVEWQSAAEPPSIESAPLPGARRLARFSGTPEEIEKALRDYDASDYPLPTFAEIEFNAESIGVIARTNLEERFHALASELHGEKMLLLRVKPDRKTSASAFTAGEEARLEELTPDIVFEERLKGETLDDEQKSELWRTYKELCELCSLESNDSVHESEATI
jgi:exonuclease SbcD